MTLINKTPKTFSAFVPCALIIASFFNISSPHAQTQAPTISNYQYIESEITKLSETSVSFDELSSIFSRLPEYKTVCYINPSNKNSKEAYDLFKQYLPSYLEGTMIFDFSGFDLGFNIFQKTELNWVDGSTNMQMDCVQNGDGCNSLSHSVEGSFDHREPNEDYSSESIKSESWRSYIFNNQIIYSELLISLSTKSLNWYGRESGTVSFSNSYLCISRLANFQTEL